MPATFFRTTRALEADRSTLWVKVTFVAPLFGAWIAWFVFGRVHVYEVTDKARLEVEDQVHGVAALVGGRVLQNQLTLGREVAAGEVLVRLDSEPEDLAHGLLRVELTPEREPASPIPLEHGLSGSVEVQVEQIAPVVLVLRAAGQCLPAQRAPDPSR
jgi:multidrug efflux pump subunit AcrA (membrane-fusion protein)